MKKVDAVGWAGTVLVLATFLLGTAHQFDIANVALCVPVALPSLVRKAYSGAAISLAFGAFSLFHLL